MLGPVTERHWVTASFMWPEKKMPDPDGARRLLDYGAKVSFRRDTLETPAKMTGNPQTDMDNMEEGGRYPKMLKDKVWVVEITMPKTLMSEIYRGSIEIEGDSFDVQDINTAQEETVQDTGVTDGT